MRKLKLIEHISLDGVIQAPGGPGEDRSILSCWAKENAFLRRELRQAHLRSIAQKLCRRASSSTRTRPLDLCRTRDKERLRCAS